MKNEEVKQKLSVIISDQTLSGNEKRQKITDLFAQDHAERVEIRVHGEGGDEHAFKAAAMPLIKYLCENHHPHVAAIITPTGAELLEGLKTLGYVGDFIRD